MSALSEIITAFARATGHGPSFVGLTYTSKSTGETARYTLNIGTSYLNLLKKSLSELDNIVGTNGLTGIEADAEKAVRASLLKSIAAHEKGEQNPDYTKAGMYECLTEGVKQSKVDGTYEICGIQVAKKVLIPGTYKTVNSSALTLAKQTITGLLSSSKYRTLCIDAGNLESVRVGGTEIEVDLPYTPADAKKTIVRGAKPVSVYGQLNDDAPEGWDGHK